MAGKYGASDLGSDWITVPRKFRGRKPTSSDTELAYITGQEKGLLSKFARANQVGPSNIPSYDDSGFENPEYYTTSTGKRSTQKIGGYDWSGKGSSTGGFRYTPPTTTAKVISRGGGSSVSRATAEKEVRDREMSQAPDAVKAAIDKGKSREVKDEDRMSGPEMDHGNRWKNVKEGDEDHDPGTGDTTTGGETRTCPSGTTGTWPNCTPVKTGEENGDKCAGKSTDCPSDRPNGAGVCDPASGNVDFSSCTADPNCPHGKNPDGSCKEKPVDEDANGDGTPSLTTIIKPDETPMLQELTNEMDLRNMLGSVLNKNNPLFKQARTRALQAMAARGVVNSSMAEEAVMSAVMNVAMPIATRVIDDLQRVMAANVNASNAFKEALNQAYYKELLQRVDAANTWNLERMKSQQVNWQEMLRAKTGAAGIADEDIFAEYMTMLKGTPGYNQKPGWNVSGT